MKTFLSSSG
jgi:hypothetical protein